MTRDWSADVSGTLEDLREWQLTPAAWSAVTDALTALDAAIHTGDDGAVRRALVRLARAGGDRTTQIGAVPCTPEPREVRERRIQIVDDLRLDESSPRR